MNVAEVKEAKSILENEIREMLSLFEQDTGCRVCDIIVRYERRATGWDARTF